MDTAERILNTTEYLMQMRGYYGFSFQDVAKEVGIQKPSLYHHFGSKAALGQAVVARYRTRMRGVSEQLTGVDGINPASALKLYLEPMLEIGRSPGGACLCGVLSGEFAGLPDAMQNEVTAYFDEHLKFIETLLTRGRGEGVFHFAPPPSAMAHIALAAIEGGMVLKRASGDATVVDQIAETLGELLGT